MFVLACYLFSTYVCSIWSISSPFGPVDEDRQARPLFTLMPAVYAHQAPASSTHDPGADVSRCLHTLLMCISMPQKHHQQHAAAAIPRSPDDIPQLLLESPKKLSKNIILYSERLAEIATEGAAGRIALTSEMVAA